MMLKRLLFAFTMLMPLLTVAQHRIVKFEKPDWNSNISKAKESGKLLFIDCNASYCIPCRKMFQQSFTVDSVADYYNSHFINISYDIDKDTPPSITNFPSIKFVPTLLFFDPITNKVVYTAVGFQDKDALLKIGKDVLNHDNYLDVWRDRYNAGNKTEEVVIPYLRLLRSGHFNVEYNKIVKPYIDSMVPEMLVRRDNWNIFNDNVFNPGTDLFIGAWNIHTVLSDSIGEKIVMDKFENTMTMAAWALVSEDANSKYMSSGFDKQKIKELLTTIVWKNRGMSIEMFYLNELVEKSDWDKLIYELTKIIGREEKNAVTLKSYSLNILKSFLYRSIGKGGSKYDKKSFKLIDKFMTDKGNAVKSDLSSFKRDMYLRLGNKLKAHEMDSLAVMYTNPNYYKKENCITIA